MGANSEELRMGLQCVEKTGKTYAIRHISIRNALRVYKYEEF